MTTALEPLGDEPVDTLLSLDLSEHDCYYRFRRDFKRESTVVYVHVQDLSIIPQDDQTYGPNVIRALKKSVVVWNQHWTTLTVFQQDGKVQFQQDKWKPHSLTSNIISQYIPRVDVLKLEVTRKRKKSCV
jgi:hypothetical protein